VLTTTLEKAIEADS
jgi:cytochrome bd-type quinol oxidase subunit 2